MQNVLIVYSISYVVYREEEERRSEKRKIITQNLKLGQEKL